MRKQYAQYAQQELSSTGVGGVQILSAPAGMQSIFFDIEDGGHLLRIDENGTITPVGGVRIINEGGNIGWGFALDRTDHDGLGKDSIDFSLPNDNTGTGGIEAGAAGDKSISIGINANSGERGIAIGYNVKASEGIAIGEHIRLGDKNSIVLGQYNEGVTGSIFEIGVGYFDDPDDVNVNAFLIDNTGVASTPLADKANITNPKDLVTLEKLEDTIVKADPDYDDHTFAIKGEIEDTTYPGFIPYIPIGRTKKIVGIRWYLVSGSCNIEISEGIIGNSAPIISQGVSSGAVGQYIWSDPANYHSITDGNMIFLEVTNGLIPRDLSVTVFLINE